MVRNTHTVAALPAICLAACAIALGGCSQFGGAQPNKAIDPNVFPTNYRADLVTDLTTNDHQPDIMSAREAYVSPPQLQQFDIASRYVACLRTVSPDGRKDRAVIFFSGRINQMRDATATQCGTAAYQPFPELLSTIATLRGKDSRQQR